jgi:methionyl-tRNA formyltransferase
MIEALLRELPARVVGIVASTALVPGMSMPHAVRRRLQMGSMFFMNARHSVEVRMLWRLARRRQPTRLPPRLKGLAAAASIALIRTRNANDADTLAALRALTPDLLVSIYFNHRLKHQVLAIAPYGAINVHPSLLPRHRGPLPSFWIVAAGEDRAGVTVHWIDEGIDSGDILLQREMAVPVGASVLTLMGTVARPGAAALVEAIRLIEAGQAPRQAQDLQAATYESWPTRRDFVQMRRRAARYGSSVDLVAACERRPIP